MPQIEGKLISGAGTICSWCSGGKCFEFHVVIIHLAGALSGLRFYDADELTVRLMGLFFFVLARFAPERRRTMAERLRDDWSALAYKFTWCRFNGRLVNSRQLANFVLLPKKKKEIQNNVPRKNRRGEAKKITQNRSFKKMFNADIV